MNEEYKKLLRSYKTLWQRAKRDRERLLIIKGLIKKINPILNQIKDYDDRDRKPTKTSKSQGQETQREGQNQV